MSKIFMNLTNEYSAQVIWLTDILQLDKEGKITDTISLVTSPAVLTIDSVIELVLCCEIRGAESLEEGAKIASEILGKLDVKPVTDNDSNAYDGFLFSKLNNYYFFCTNTFPDGVNAHIGDSAFYNLPETPLELMPTYPSGHTDGDEIKIDDFLSYVKPFILKKDWISLVGGLATQERTENDIDVTVGEIHPAQLEKVAKFRFLRGVPEHLTRRLSFLPRGTINGPITSYYPLGDLVFLPNEHFKKVNMDNPTQSFDISNQMDDLYNWLTTTLEGKCTQEDTGVFVFPSWEDVKYVFCAYPVILYNVGDAYSAMLACECWILSDKYDVVTDEQALQYANEALDALEIHPFKDSDSGGIEHFLIPCKNGHRFYCSPDYPAGWNDNHILPSAGYLNKMQEQLRAAPKSIEKQADKSNREDRIVISRMFYPMKPVRGAPSGAPQTVDNLMRVANTYPWLVSKKYDGNTIIIFKLEDEAKIFSDDGKEITEFIPSLYQAVMDIPLTSFVCLAEMELWVDGIHYPRESVRQALTSRKYYEPHLIANIFELVYINGRDLHKADAFKRHSVAKQAFALLPPGEVASDSILRFVTQYPVRNPGELRSATTKLSSLPGSEGVVLKRGDYTLDGKAMTSQSIKYHKSATTNVIIVESSMTKSGTFVYTLGLLDTPQYGLPSQPTQDMEGVGKVVTIGKSFATSTVFDVGNVVQLNFETLNFIMRQDKNTYKMTLWAPMVIKQVTQLPHTINNAVEIAREVGILQEKYVVGKEIYYDKAKVPPRQESNIHTFSENVEIFVASFIQNPVDGKWVNEIQEKMGLEEITPCGATGLHLTIALYKQVSDMNIIEEISQQLADTKSFDFIADKIELLGEEGNTVVLSGSVPPALVKLVDRLRQKDDTTWAFKPHITLGEIHPDKGETFPKTLPSFPHRIPMSKPVVMCNAITQERIKEDPYLTYPEHGKKLKVMRHLHCRGKSAHFDVRRQLDNDWLVGWTENIQKEGKIDFDVDTLDEARKVFSGYSVDNGNTYLKPLSSPSKLVVETLERRVHDEKAKEPIEWMSFVGVTQPGEIGATKEHEGTLLIVDEGVTEWGASKPEYHEYFDSGGKIFNGRYVVRLLNDVWNITPEKNVWMAWYADDPTPYVLSKRAVKLGWMPPDGQSALPEVIRDNISEEYHYWMKEGDEAKHLRDKLVNAKLLKMTFGANGQMLTEVCSPCSPTASPCNSTCLPVLTKSEAAVKTTDFSLLNRADEDHEWFVLMIKSPFTCLIFKNNYVGRFQYGSPDEEKLFDVAGEIPAKGNSVGFDQEIVETGEVKVLIDTNYLKAFHFKGDKLNNLYVAADNVFQQVEDTEIHVMKPSVRFELDERKSFANVWEEWGKERIQRTIMLQSKENGTRILAEKVDGKIKLTDDDRNNVTTEYEELFTKMLKEHDDIVIDTETMPAKKKVIILTVLKYKGVDLTGVTELTRWRLSESLFSNVIHTRVADTKQKFTDTINSLKQVVKEGLVLKTADSVYQQQETNDWAKIRFVRIRTGGILAKLPKQNGLFTYRVKDAQGTYETQPTKIDVDIGAKLELSHPKIGGAPRVIGVIS